MAEPIGHNRPPPESGEDVKARLEEQNKDLLNDAADLEIAFSALPKVCDTPEGLEKLNGYAGKVKALIDQAEAARVEQKKPYDAIVAAVQAFFVDDLTGRKGDRVKPSTGLVRLRERALQVASAYLAAEAEKERVRLENEAADKRRAEQAAAQAAAEQRARADELERQAAAAAEAARAQGAAHDATVQAEAARLAVEADNARSDATVADQEQLQAGRVAEAHERRADAGPGTLSTTRTASGQIGLSTYWDVAVDDREKVLATLGPLGPYFRPADIEGALRDAMRAGKRDEEGAPFVPGCRIFQNSRARQRS